jgi:hypothetical protein
LSAPGREEAVEELKREEESSRRGLLEQVAELSNAAKEITRLMEANDEDKQPISFSNEVSPPLAIATETRNDFANDPELTTKQAPSSDRPTRIYVEHILYKQTSQYAKTCTSFYCTERCIAGDYSRCMSSLSVLHLGVSQVPLLYLTLARAS